MSSYLRKSHTWNKALYVAKPVLNPLSSDLIYEGILTKLPPLDVIFWIGWRWSIVVFVFGAIPIFLYLVGGLVVMAYLGVISEGGDGSERVPGSKIEWFYSLSRRARYDIYCGFVRYSDPVFDSEVSAIISSDTSYLGSDQETSKLAPESRASLRRGSYQKRGAV